MSRPVTVTLAMIERRARRIRAQQAELQALIVEAGEAGVSSRTIGARAGLSHVAVAARLGRVLRTD